MKFSEQWLREWVNPAINTETLVEQLTMAGLEVDSVEPVAAEFSGVVVGEIVQCEQHPDADKLRVCQVVSDDDAVQVVCGAPNAAVGLKVPFAKVGAVLPGDFKIKKAKLRGVESFGMLCAEEELGLTEKSDGLMELPADAPVGTNIRTYLQLDDNVIEVDLTPNRGDCLSIAGLARETGVLNKRNVETPEWCVVEPQIDDQFLVDIQAPQDCPAYVGRVVRNVDVSAVTPLWMIERLRRSGVRSIDVVVDVTNYVLLELGQPMHAFDLDTLVDGIVVRHASCGEKLTLLTGQTLTLTENTLVIADHQRALAMAGVMGGEHSGVTAQTKHIFLESAFFDPQRIAGKARSYGLHTDSSHRFERGVDYTRQRRAIERATQLLLSIAGGEPGPVTEKISTEHLPQRLPVALRRHRITQMLGLELDDAEVTDILSRLGLVLTTVSGGWQIDVPAYRFDISIEADVLEELARIYGYNRLPTELLKGSLALPKKPETRLPLSSLRRFLTARGYQEAITYSFVDPVVMKLIEPDLDAIALINPISSDMSVMRTSLWPGLLKVALYNLNRQQNRVRLFETGLVFLPGDKLRQEAKLAGLLCGSRDPESWSNTAQPIDFYDAKGHIESLLALAGNGEEIRFLADKHTALHNGQSARICHVDGDGDSQDIGWIGALHPSIQKKLGVNIGIYLFELSLDLVQRGNLPKFKELSKFPELRRDLAIIIDQEVESSAISDIVHEVAGDYLIDLILFDVYQGKGIDSKRKSLALGLTYQHHSRTLNEDEINASVGKVVTALEHKFNAALRNF